MVRQTPRYDTNALQVRHRYVEKENQRQIVVGPAGDSRKWGKS